jgi:signal transduction histidine kinase
MKSYAFCTVFISIIVVIANFIRQDFSFYKEKSFIVSNSYEEVFLQDRDKTEIKNGVVKIFRKDEIFLLFSNKASFTNPLGSIFNYLCFEFFFFSVLIFSSIFILFQFFHFKERAYLHYVGYVVCILLYFARSWRFGTQDGQIILYQIKNAHQGETALSAATIILYIIFIRSFLNIDKPSAAFIKVTNLIVTVSIAFGCLGILYGLMWDEDWLILEVIYKSLLVPLTALTLVQIFKSIRKKLALYIAVGSLALFVGALFTGFVGLYDINNQSIHIFNESKLFFYKSGIILEILFFTTGLGYRTKLIDEEKNKLILERLQLSRDLHDDIGATLSSLSNLSEVAKYQIGEENEIAKSTIEKINEKVKKVAQDLRMVVFSTNSIQKTLKDLYLIILDHATDAFIGKPIEVIYNIDEKELKKVTISGEYLHQIALICKEVITNISKHARCSKVVLSIETNRKDIYVTIEDNGVGIPTGKEGNSLLPGNGLQNIQERARKINAQIKIHSQTGVGVRVDLHIPYII